jgi:hypothetical protein
VPLVLELAGGADVAGAMGQPWVERCGDCGGAFLPKEAVGLFVAARPPSDSAGGADGAASPSLWARLAEALRSLVGG